MTTSQQLPLFYNRENQTVQECISKVTSEFKYYVKIHNIAFQWINRALLVIGNFVLLVSTVVEHLIEKVYIAGP